MLAPLIPTPADVNVKSSFLSDHVPLDTAVVVPVLYTLKETVGLFLSIPTIEYSCGNDNKLPAFLVIKLPDALAV